MSSSKSSEQIEFNAQTQSMLESICKTLGVDRSQALTLAIECLYHEMDEVGRAGAGNEPAATQWLQSGALQSLGTHLSQLQAGVSINWEASPLMEQLTQSDGKDADK